MKDLEYQLKDLNKILEGELHFDDLYKSIYATDASVYRKIPQELQGLHWLVNVLGMELLLM